MGRKKKEPTKVVRVPESLVEDFQNIIKHHPKEWYYVLDSYLKSKKKAK